MSLQHEHIINMRLDTRTLAAVDQYIVRLRAAAPGYSLSRSAALRILIMRGLVQGGFKPRVVRARPKTRLRAAAEAKGVKRAKAARARKVKANRARKA